MGSTSTEPRYYVDFEPRIEWLKGKEIDTIIVDVSGFKKEQLKVLISTAGILKISGERPIEGNHWTRFLHSLPIPKNINVKGIQAKFDGDEGLLYVILPISIFSAPEITPPPPTKAPDSSELTSTHHVAPSPKMPEKVAAAEEEEEERGRISGEKINGDSYKEDRNRVESGSRGAVLSSVINKRKLAILSVILGVMASLGLAVYLSYRFKGL